MDWLLPWILVILRSNIPNCQRTGVTADNPSPSTSRLTVYLCRHISRLRALRHIRKCVTSNIARTISNALVSSRMDYCNSILYGTSRANEHELRHVQTTLARIFTGALWPDIIVPLLVDFYWLPAHYGDRYKIILTTFLVLTMGKAALFSETNWSLRFCSKNLLRDKAARLPFAKRAFVVPRTVWNSLPLTLIYDLPACRLLKTDSKLNLTVLPFTTVHRLRSARILRRFCWVQCVIKNKTVKVTLAVILCGLCFTCSVGVRDAPIV